MTTTAAQITKTAGAFTVLACLRDEFQPANQHEFFLTGQMAPSRWRPVSYTHLTLPTNREV